MTVTTKKILRRAFQVAFLLLFLTAAGPGFTGEQQAITKANWMTPEVNVRSFQNPGFASMDTQIFYLEDGFSL